jgi:hypothetical protein
MIPLFPHGSANFNAKSSTYGARGNGTGDDTAALQACITAARGDVSAWYPNPSNPPDENDDIPEAAVGSTAFIPRGDYVLTSSLVLENAQFTRIWCEPEPTSSGTDRQIRTCSSSTGPRTGSSTRTS